MNKYIYSFVLFLILIIGSYLRLNQLEMPSGYLFDEHYHIPTAKLIAKGDKRAFEWWHGELAGEVSGSWIDWLHPPFNKYLQAGAINIFGEENPIAWRISSAIFGVILIMGVAYLSYVSFGSANAALIASALIAFDPMMISMSRIGMNDMTMVGLSVIGVIFWQKWRKSVGSSDWLWWLLASIFFGLAASCKWSAVLILPVIILSTWMEKKVKNIDMGLNLALVMGLIIFLIYLMMYIPMFVNGKSLVDFYLLNEQILRYQLLNDLHHPSSSGPLEWVLGQKEIWLTTRPEQLSTPIILHESKLIIKLGITAIFLTFISTVIFYLTKNKFVEKKLSQHKILETSLNDKDLCEIILYVFLYGFSFLLWIRSPRPMFLYHYLPALPYLFILVGFWIDKIYLFFRKIFFLK